MRFITFYFTCKLCFHGTALSTSVLYNEVKFSSCSSHFSCFYCSKIMWICWLTLSLCLVIRYWYLASMYWYSIATQNLAISSPHPYKVLSLRDSSCKPIITEIVQFSRCTGSIFLAYRHIDNLFSLGLGGISISQYGDMTLDIVLDFRCCNIMIWHEWSVFLVLNAPLQQRNAIFWTC